LLPLAHVTSALQAFTVPAGVDFFLVGAAARDLILRYVHNIEPQRLTEDIDFAVMVCDWETFEALRSGLVASGHFVPPPGPATHRL
jgi:predicted nucleotidyltransferase